MLKKTLPLIVALAVLLAACAPAGPRTLTVMTHDSFAVSEDLVRQFEAQNNARVVFLKSGDAGTTLNKAILSKDAPLADVLFGVDNTFLSRALDAGIFDPYEAPGLAAIPAGFRLDPQNRAIPVNFGDVCINYDTRWFAESGLSLPQSLNDLTDPAYKGLLVVQNPATSSPGLAFLLATVAAFGEEGFADYWAALRANDVKVVDGWETAYYTEFSGSSGAGPRPMVVSYASSPAAEMIFADPRPETPPTAALTTAGMCFRQVEFVGILRGTPNRDLAEKWVDFMLATPFQEDLPLQMFVYPVNPAAALPQDFADYAPVVPQPAALDPTAIAASREKWIETWTETVLR